MMFPVAILAGGKATRLGPLAGSIPKALLEVAGRPFVCRQLEYLRGQGVKEVVLCIGHLGERIEAVVGDGSAFGVNVRYSPDGPVLLGTGGALKQALPLLGERFFVLYGDVFLPCDFARVQKAYLESGQPAMMAVFRNRNRWDGSNVLFRDGRLVEYNKRAPRPEMEHIDYGLGILSSGVLDEEPAGRPFDLADVYHRLSRTGQLAGHEVGVRFFEIGSRPGIRDAEEYFLLKGEAMNYTQRHLHEAAGILSGMDVSAVEKMADLLAGVKRDGGRIFFLGVGGSAGNCSHAVNDFRKIAGIESYAPTDNVSELTARTNDEGWATVFAEWLKGSRLSGKDAVFVLSVGGGDLERNISPNLVRALELARATGAKIAGIVGRDGGYTAKVADSCVIVPTVNPETVTPHTEAFQSVLLHLLVSHPKLKANPTKWESTER